MNGEYSKFFIIIIFFLFLILCVIVEAFFPIPSVSLHEASLFAEHHQGLISASGIIISIIIFYLTLRKQENDRKEETTKRLRTACQIISQEIEEFQRRLSDNSRIVRDIHPEFFNIHFNFDGYESILHSDLFSHFDEVTQFEIKALYERIKLHNEFSMYRLSLQNQYFFI